jgi:putative membrane protein
MMHDWMGWGSGGWGGGWFGPFFMLIPLAVLAVIVFLAIRWVGGGGMRTPVSRTARDILDERFAKGEIDREEYDSRRDALNK